jgi:hypothetical protein
MGEDLERVAELVADKHLTEIAAYKSEREAAGKSTRRAYPESLKGRPKRSRRRPAEKKAAKPVGAPDGNRKPPRISKLPDGTIVTDY